MQIFFILNFFLEFFCLEFFMLNMLVSLFFGMQLIAKLSIFRQSIQISLQ